MKGRLLALIAVAGALAVPVSNNLTSAQEKAKVDKAAVERARKQVRMLDDIYKLTVVLITDKYVHDKKDFPAGRAAVKLFSEITKKGHHGVRLIDVSGEPYSPQNVAQDDYEKRGVVQIKKGKAYHDEVEQKDGKQYLRAITPIPVVMDKCILCHDHYKNAKKGEAVGAITYSIPIE